MDGQSGGGGLEDRLRNMILNNANHDMPQSPPKGPRFHQHHAPPPTRNMQSQQPPGFNTNLSPPEPFTNDAQLSPSLSKAKPKRPNQAQRRQMSAQLSIPIDTRPQMPQFGRGYVSPPAYQQFSHSTQSRVQRPQSATFRPPSQGNPMHAPPAGGSFTAHPRHHPSLSYHGPMSSPSDWNMAPPPNGDQRVPHHGPPTPFDPASPRSSRHTPSGSYGSNKIYHVRPEDVKAQSDLLDRLCNTIIKGAEINREDIEEKENFRARIEDVARHVITQYEREFHGFHNFPSTSVQLRCFGSLSSGFATKAADMDLGLLSPLSSVQPDAPGSPIPRLVEKAFLEVGLGARLLTRTRIPIIKVCEKPDEALRLALLEERRKWEQGLPDDLIDEDDGPDDADHDVADETPAHDHQRHDRKASSQTKDEPTTQQRFRSLKQSDKKSISAYYNSAKGVLRKAGGRDLTHSNATDMKKEDLELLNEFNVAFVDGLADKNLRDRLLNYKSLNRYDLTYKPNYRTLLGVYTQVEGEFIAMMWESREVREKNDLYEQQALSVLRSWRSLGNRTQYGQDPIGFAKDIQFAFEQLKKISSIQVMLLSQGQHETAAAYHSRTTKVMSELGILDESSEDNTALHLVIHYYVEGIFNEQIREQVQQYAASQSKKALLLRAISRRHKSLQLAQEYEKCLEKDLYPEPARAIIRDYITVLRAQLTGSTTDDPLFRLVIPLPADGAQLLSRIHSLGDPAKMAPNQPRDPYRDRLEFPKFGVGVQCDINFSAHLALQNTLLLRCYSHCDERVRPLVLFIKHWAKVRQINSPYRGTLSSYGYVLMVLHYLVNIAQPFVCPNLQKLARPPPPNLTPQEVEETMQCKGRDIQFWRDEVEIQRLARENALTQNRDSIGQLLRGFFEYYAQGNQMSTVPARGFDWGRDVLSLRTHGGLLSKQEKGWTGAKTVIEVKAAPVPPLAPTVTASIDPSVVHVPDASPLEQPGSPPAATQAGGQVTREFKEVRHRYLFAIEDPFELEHNVARTVTHNGIVAIRDEFRRAWRIIKMAGREGSHQEDLLEDIAKADERREHMQFEQLLEELHGPRTSVW